MLAGMFVGEWLAPTVARHFGLAWSLSAMIAAMLTGMICGMALWTAMASAVKERLGTDAT
jgi:predicted small integral membrane protein